MPIYEYQCNACEHEFEAIQKFSDAPVTDCPHCTKAGTVSKKLSVSAFILSGGGWYKEGYSGGKNGGSAKNGGSESKPESSGGSEGGSVSAADAGCGHGGCGHCAA